MYRWHDPDKDALRTRAKASSPPDAEGSDPPVSEVHSPTLRRRELSLKPSALRNDLGLTVEQVVKRLLCSPSKVSRMETGQRCATPWDVRDLCNVCAVISPDERAPIGGLAVEDKPNASWEPYRFGCCTTYIGLAETATAIGQYQLLSVPGLLQTPDYTHAVTDALQFSAVIDEVALGRGAGGSVAMGVQLKRLIKTTRFSRWITCSASWTSRSQRLAWCMLRAWSVGSRSNVSKISYVTNKYSINCKMRH